MSSIPVIHNRLTVGCVAPDFEVTDSFDQPIRLSQYVGKPVLLSFFRNGACAMCNLRVHQLIQRYEALHKKRLEILAVFESPRDSIRQYVGKQDAPFPIIPDPAARLYELYGLEVSEEKVNASVNYPETAQHIQEAAQLGFALTPEEGSNFFRIPADFLIDKSGRIHTSYYAERVGDHLSFDAIEQFLATV